MHNDTHKYQRFDFIVKFSPSVCVAVVASLTGEMAAQSFAYNAHGLAQVCPPMMNYLTSLCPSIIPKFG